MASLDLIVPGRVNADVLFDFEGDTSHDPSLSTIQLVEGSEYRFAFSSPIPVESIQLDPEELFSPDDSTGTRGRLRTGLYVGTVKLAARTGTLQLGEATIEIRSKKLDYLAEYRWMIRDVAAELTELAQERFAASQAKFAPSHTSDARTAYQRFAFLKAIIEDETYLAGLHHVLERPFISWEAEPEIRRPASGLRGGSYLPRALARPGARQPWSFDHPVVHSVPRSLVIEKRAESIDNVPNQFVRFVLEHWRDEALRIGVLLQNEAPSPAARRGLVEVEQVASTLDEFLLHGVLREASSLQRIPLENQAIQKREGYRDVLAAYLQYELSSVLSWDGSDEVYGAGAKNVAALYEYWVFLQITRIVADLCGQRFELRDLLALDDSALHVRLNRGKESQLLGTLECSGVHIDVELWYNKQFVPPAGSWSLKMIPDCSLRLTPRTNGVTDDVWLHFDAKYRIDTLTQLLSTEDSAVEGAGPTDRAVSSDMLKMHAYHDAIRRTAGSYVVYPGKDSTVPLREFHEILPGVGAFGLRPTETGDVSGVGNVRGFISDVVDHMASAISQRRRAQYWSRVSTADASATAARIVRNAFPVPRPPADTLVLLGYVRGSQHLEWIRAQRRYNMRAGNRRGAIGLGARELATDLLLLYGSAGVHLFEIASSPAELWSREDLLETGYPDPRGERYFCIPLGLQLTLPDGWTVRLIESLIDSVRGTAPTRAPHVVSAADLFVFAE